MKERPILMCSTMVRAVLANRKRQTRRVIKQQPDEDGLAKLIGGPWTDTSGKIYPCPHGEIGTYLWVKERGWLSPSKTAWVPFVGNEARGKKPPTNPEGWPYKVYPSIFMPKWACRIRLEITEVRVERVQDITEGDAEAEGGPAILGFEDGKNSMGWMSYREWYKALWDSLNADRGFGWDVNPWTWCITFKAIDDITEIALQQR